MGDLGAIVRRLGGAVLNAANAAVKETVTYGVGQARATLAGALGRRASQTITSKVDIDRKAGPDTVFGFIHSRWFRLPRGGGTGGKLAAFDILARLEQGGGIIPQKGRWLVLPIVARGALATGRAQINFKDPDLEFIPLAGRRGFLVVDMRGGRLSPVRSGKGRRPLRARGRGTPILLLLDRVYLHRNFDLAPLRQALQPYLRDRFVVDLAKADVALAA